MLLHGNRYERWQVTASGECIVATMDNGASQVPRETALDGSGSGAGNGLQTGVEPIRVIMYVKYLPPRYSGAGQQALSLAGALRRRGLQCEFLTETTPEKPSDYDLGGFHVRTFYEATESVSIQPLRCLAFARVAGRRRRKRSTVFHAHSAYPEASALGFTARMLGIPSILKVTLHASDADVSSSRLVGRLHHRLLKRQGAIVAISREIEAELRALQIEPDRIQAIPNGVDTERFRPTTKEQKAAARRRLGLPAPPRAIVLFAGVLTERKNVGWLLDTWEAYAREGGAGHLVLAGPASGDPADPLRNRIEALVGDRDVRVHWLGRLAAMEDAYAAADLFVLPAKSEGMPNVVLEAMAAGLPVAVTAVSGTQDMLGPEQAGIAIRPDDTSELKAALALPSTEPRRLAALASAARRRAAEAFSLASVAERYERLYRRLLTRHPGIGE